MSIYFIDTSGTKDGPHDLVTVMRRIRAGKIGPETGIYKDEEGPTPASVLPDTAMFFSRSAETVAKHTEIPVLRLIPLLREGWRFTSENSIMTVFAGGLLLLSILLSTSMVQAFGPVFGSILGWLSFLMLHNLYLVCCLRLYRNQPFSARFWREQLAPRLTLLLGLAIVVGLMMVGGFTLLVLPGILVGMAYAFAPFFILDRHMSLVEAMTASRLLVRKHGGFYQRNVALLMLMHIGAMLLIIPVPVTLPMFAACLSRFYEELSTS
ncbi:MAG: hypothetical protein K2Q01_10580 [Rickettsiales bacterium]|nr:hypothetical protein [Rickettsiales bacterium]